MIDIEAHQNAARSLTTLLSRGDTIHNESFYYGLARRLVANALLVRGYLEAVVEGDRVQLRQQRSLELEDADWWGEHVHHLRRELTDAEAIYERVKASHVAEFDPDARDLDVEDRRAKEQRQDQAAADDAPRVRAS